MNLTERIPIEKLNALASMTYAYFKPYSRETSEVKRKESFDKIKKYINRGVKSKGISDRQYLHSENNPFGRLVCGSSIQGVVREVRGFLLKDTTTDIDLINCHPKILEHICGLHQIPCPRLAYYNRNRKQELSRLEDGKILYLKSVNSDKTTKSSDDGLRQFDKEIKTIQKRLYTIEAYQDIVKTVPDTKTYNWMGSAINRILCYYENIILHKIVNVVTSKNIEICALMYDGLMIYGNFYSDTSLLNDVNTALEEYNMEVSYKAHYTSFDPPPNVEESDEKHTDKSATIALLEAYGFWRFSGNELYVYDERYGLWSTCANIHRFYIMKYTPGEHGTRAGLVDNVLKLVKALCYDPHWITEMENTSLGYLLFSNGYYSFKTRTFTEGFTPAIYFYHRIGHSYSETRNATYEDSIKNRLFLDQHGEAMGNYMISLFARGLAGDQQKHVLFGLGESNTGKSCMAKFMSASFGDYIGNFNGECLAFTSSTADEASKMRWAKLISKTRLLFSSELNMRQKLNGNLMKKLSSGGEDRLIGRGHCESEMAFSTHFLPIVLAQDVPEITPYDKAVDNRLRVFGFNKIYSTTPGANELLLDPNLDEEIKTDEFKMAMLHIMADAYSSPLIEPSEATEFKREWVGEVVNIMTVFTDSFEFTNDVNDFVATADMAGWCGEHKISSVKLGREIGAYAKSLKMENVVTKMKKISGKSFRGWPGIKAISNCQLDDEPDDI
jgi:phage/plasmid-associated DNA primase